MSLKSRPKTFRGRPIYGCSLKLYPCVTWKEHPTANANGIVYIHRLIAYERYGKIVLKSHVHHKDEDVWNWSISNLEVMTPGSHASLHHKGEGVWRLCSECGDPVEARNSRRASQRDIYCDEACRRSGQMKIKWPSKPVLLARLSAASVVSVARELGVTDNAIRKRLNLGWYAKNKIKTRSSRS